MIDLLVSKIDADRGEMRNMKDAKGKKPDQYDKSSQYTELFSTSWDHAKEGNVRKLKACLDQGRFEVDQQTPYLKNTALHIAVKSLQLDVVKTLIYEY